jgi:hypothetical protein
VLADNSTAGALLAAVYANCSTYLSPTLPTTPISGGPTPFSDANTTAAPRPENAVQYYRASSVVLALDGYNDSAVLSDAVATMNGSVSTAPLPPGVDTALLGCLNDTLGAAVPLVDGGARTGAGASAQLAGAALALWLVRALL